MQWKKDEGEGMDPAEAKRKALGLFNLWLDSRKADLAHLDGEWARKYQRVRRLAEKRVSNTLARKLLKALEWLVFMSAQWTGHKIQQLKGEVQSIQEAVRDLNAENPDPDKAIKLLAKNFMGVTMTPLDGPDPLAGSSQIFYANLLAGLGQLRRKA